MTVRLQAGWAGLRRGWGVTGSVVTSDVQGPVQGVRELVREGRVIGWWLEEPDAAGTLGRQLFGVGGERTAVAREVLRHFGEEARQGFARALDAEVGESLLDPPAASASPWNAPASWRCGLAWRLSLLPAAFIDAGSLRDGAVDVSVIALREAVAQQPLRLEVRLRPCESTLGELQDLQCGDVLGVTHGLDEPMRVLSAGRRELFTAQLGRRADRLAVQARAPALEELS